MVAMPKAYRHGWVKPPSVIANENRGSETSMSMPRTPDFETYIKIIMNLISVHL